MAVTPSQRVSQAGGFGGQQRDYRWYSQVKMSDQSVLFVWIFSGAKKHFPGGVFTRRDVAESWITKNHFIGTLTLYPVDVGAYEWAFDKGLFHQRMPHESEPEFIGGFSDAGMEHYHYEEGERQNG